MGTFHFEYYGLSHELQYCKDFAPGILEVSDQAKLVKNSSTLGIDLPKDSKKQYGQTIFPHLAVITMYSRNQVLQYLILDNASNEDIENLFTGVYTDLD